MLFFDIHFGSYHQFSGCNNIPLSVFDQKYWQNLTVVGNDQLDFYTVRNIPREPKYLSFAVFTKFSVSDSCQILSVFSCFPFIIWYRSLQYRFRFRFYLDSKHTGYRIQFLYWLLWGMDIRSKLTPRTGILFCFPVLYFLWSNSNRCFGSLK